MSIKRGPLHRPGLRRPAPERGARAALGDVRDRTILVQRALTLGAEDDTKTTQHRTVRVLGPLKTDLAEWRLLQGRPDDDELLFPGRTGEPWSTAAYQSWRRRAFARAAAQASAEHATPYVLRHSFASLLLHERRGVVMSPASSATTPASRSAATAT